MKIRNIGAFEFTCSRCGAKSIKKLAYPDYNNAFDLTEGLNIKLGHMCNKENHECGIMTITGMTLSDEIDFDNINVKENGEFSILPFKEDKETKDEV